MARLNRPEERKQVVLIIVDKSVLSKPIRTFGPRANDMKHDASSAGRVPEDRHRLGVTVEASNVVLNPLQRQAQIFQALVSCGRKGDEIQI